MSCRISFYGISKPDLDVPSVIDADACSDSPPYEYDYDSCADPVVKEVGVHVTIKHQALNLFDALSQICGFKVTSASWLRSPYDANGGGGYLARSDDGRTQTVPDEKLGPFRFVDYTPGVVFCREFISESDNWFFDVIVENKILSEDDILSAMLAVVREEECCGYVGESLYALTKALAAIKNGKTVYAVRD